MYDELEVELEICVVNNIIYRFFKKVLFTCVESFFQVW